MLKAQDAGLKAFKPGTKCSDVDKASRKVIEKAGYEALIRHHTGHGLGLEGHEPPWLDIGDDTIMKPGMVFRDTVVITEDGSEILTYYPRDLESLTISTR